MSQVPQIISPPLRGRASRAVYVGGLVVIVLAAAIGLLLTLHGSAGPDRPGAASGVTTQQSNGTSATDTTPPPASSSTPTAQFAHAYDRRGDTTGPDLVELTATTVDKSLRVRVSLATAVTDPVIIQLFIDADTDRTTGSLSFPCSSATLGVDYLVTIRGSEARLMSSVANGCRAPFRTVRAAAPSLRISTYAVVVRIPTAEIHRPATHLLEMYAQAALVSGGQIDFCPGQHDRPLSVRY